MAVFLPNRIPKIQVCDARGDAMKYFSLANKKLLLNI